jgi:hypothetical protein
MDTISSNVPDAGDAIPSCTPLQLFVDLDGDGFGSDAVAPQTRCETAGWVERGGDCLDAVPTADNHAKDVHKEQTRYFEVGYPVPGQPGQVSFDYDCSGGEEAAPGTTALASGDADDCSSTSLSCNSLTGMLPVARSGANVNVVCGSKTALVCNLGAGGQCVPQLFDRTSDPSLCR